MSTQSTEAEALLHPHNMAEVHATPSFFFLSSAFDRLYEATHILGNRVDSSLNYTGIKLTREETDSLLRTLAPYETVMKDAKDFKAAMNEYATKSYHEGHIFRMYEQEANTWRIGVFIGSSKSGGLIAARVTKNAEGSSFSIDSGDSSEPFFKSPANRYRESPFVSAFRAIADSRRTEVVYRERSTAEPE